MQEIKIVDFNEKYAAGVAEMWRNSLQGWNGDSFMTTAEDVIQDHNNASYLNAWLAVQNEQVLGYCNLYEYQEDTGALYIGLLNVRDDYHGKKIGKKLLLKAIETTIQFGWDRLDLYTWSGNTKAVPLYKKCGFFWEDRDDCTHLMNFLPALMQNELLKECFNHFRWYEDSTRPIEVKPDGRKENEFEYYTYHWKTKEDFLMVDFARRGRGLRRIETSDYAISATVENLKLTFGSRYRVTYQFENKTDQPMKIQIVGKDDQNIHFHFQDKFELIGRKSIDACFKVNPIKKEQNDFKKHPGVVADIYLNGKKAEFRVGIEPTFPLSIVMKKENKVHPIHQEQEMYLDVENGFSERVKYQFSLPSNDEIEFLNQNFDFTLEPKQRMSLPCPFVLKKGTVYAKDISVSAIRETGDEFSFLVPIDSYFYTQMDLFWGKGKHFYIAGNGAYGLAVQHIDRLNAKRFYRMEKKGHGIGFSYPHFKQPIQDEFNKRRFDRIDFKKEDTAVLISLCYSSEKAKGFTFVEHLKLFANGLMERWFEFDNQTDKKIIMQDNFHLNSDQLIIPYDGKMITLHSEEKYGLGNFDARYVTENWLFFDVEFSKNAISWQDDAKINFGDWKFYFEYEILPSKGQSKRITKPIQYSQNYYRDWQELRSFITGKKSQLMDISNSIELNLNDKNPIAKEKVSVEVHDHRKVNTTMEISFSSGQESTSIVITPESNKRFQRSSIKIGSEPIQKIHVKLQEEELSKSFEQLIFKSVPDQIDKQELNLSGKKVKQVSNQFIQLRSSDMFAPVLFSLQYQGKEWLDHSFPEACCKSWWNPWIGGIGIVPNDIQMKTILAQPFTVEFVKFPDNHENRWEGIRISTEYQEYERWKGLVIHQYYLLLPGIPIMLNAVEIEQKTNKMLTNFLIETEAFYKNRKQIDDCRFEFANEIEQSVAIQAGKREYERKLSSPVTISGDQTNLHLVFDDHVTNHIQYVDTQLLTSWSGDRINCPSGQRCWMGHKFFVFSDFDFNQNMIRDLFTIHFK